MIRVLPFRPEHLAMLTPQPEQRAQLGGDVLARGAALAATGNCFSVYSAADGALLMCGGAFETHAEHATMWSAFAELAPSRLREMATIRQRTRWLIVKLKHRRVDALIRMDHRAAHCWIHALGFRPEARLNDYFEDGGDAMIYRLAR
jgi:hypothetical protein